MIDYTEKLNKKKPNRGFTMVEILVVIFITGLLATLVIVDFRKGKMRSDLKEAALSVAESVRTVQNFAMTGQIQSCSVPASGCGFLLYIDLATPTYFTTFADNNGDLIYTTGTDTLVEGGRVKLPGNVVYEGIINVRKITDITSPFSHEIREPFTVVFKPMIRKPEFFPPLVFPNNYSAIVLIHKVINEKKYVVINSQTGQVEIL